MKSYNEEIAELEVVRALLFERIKNGLSKKIARFYNEMIDDLQAQILKDKNIATHLKETIADLKSRLSTPDLHKDFAAIARSELEHLDNYNKILGFALFARVLPEKSIESLINTTLVQGATIKAWNYGLQADQAKRLERDLKIGISLGETNALLAQRIAASLGKSKREATTLAVTGAGAIVSEVRQKFFEANDDVIKYYQYQATLDTRTSELCRAYDGLLWDTEYKPVDHKLPFRMPRVNTHFNCRSTIIPITKSWEELGVEGMEEIDIGTRASMNGYVPKNMNFNDWLKTQPSETIEKTLGKGRAELFLQGKITMRDLITQQGRSVDLTTLYLKTGLPNFGKNYDDFYHKGAEAVSKLIKEKSGQVAGAFYKKGLGDIDLVWGDDKVGLKKIINKHLLDFEELGGISKGIEKIVKEGEVVTNGRVKTILYRNKNGLFRVGLSKGWDGTGDNEWIVTAYKYTKG